MPLRWLGSIAQGRVHRSEVVNAWVNFNNSGVIADSHNVSSITDSAAGDFTVVLLVRQASANAFVVFGSVKETAITYLSVKGDTVVGPTSVNMITGGSAGGATDPTDVYVAFIGD